MRAFFIRRTLPKCKKHPRYKALRKPRCECMRCWAIWLDYRPLTKGEQKLMKNR